jgi:hypothetical protein
VAIVAMAASTVAFGQCPGDCNGNGAVGIQELIRGVGIATGSISLAECPAFDTDGSDTVTIGELIAAVANALGGCPATPTSPPLTATRTPTVTHTLAPTGTRTLTSTIAVTATGTATATNAPPASPTATDTSSPEPSVTASPTSVTSPSDTATATPTQTIDATFTVTAEPTATSTPPVALTATASPTRTPTRTPVPTANTCGNGFLQQGETCASCPADCTVSACTATTTMVTFQVQFKRPLGTMPTAATTLLGYRSNRASLPGSGMVTTVRQRVTYPSPLPNSTAISDLDYAVRVVIGRTAGLSDGLLYSVKFDRCQGAPAVTAADFGCTVEACAGAGGPIAGCTCTVTGP